MIGLWKSSNDKVYVSHAKGLDQEQITYLHNLKVGDRLTLFLNDVRDGEKGPIFTLKRSLIR